MRREGDLSLPAGPKARRTRASLVHAAKELFSANGYSNTSVAEIADTAGVSLGTFYQYFRDRNDILVTMLTHHLESMFKETGSQWRVRDGRAGARRLIAAFVVNYATAADMVGVWEEVSHLDADMADLRRALGRGMVEPLERELVRAGRQGLCRRFTPAEAAIAATALAGMVDRFCYMSFVFDPPQGGVDPSLAADVLADLWASSIELTV